MEKQNKTIAWRNLPTRAPLFQTCTAYLLMKEQHAPEWCWGVVGAIAVIVWISSIYSAFTEEKVDIFKTKD